MTMTVPKDVKDIIGILEAHDYEAYAVGGCVRDTLLLRMPGDWDITTSAKPEEVKSLFAHTIDTGIEHGTVTIMKNHVGYEVTTYRIDGEYEDARHPKEVIFTANLVEDLKRRDFTINAMAYNERAGLVDVFDGVGDLNRRLIRCVGVPEERFSEDALRMLRAVRFSAQLGFSIEEGTKAAIRLLAPTIAKVSKERIMVELVKTLTSSHPEAIEEARELGLTAVFLPEYDAVSAKERKEILRVLQAIRPEKKMRLAALFSGISDGRTAKSILRRLKFDNATVDFVGKMVTYCNQVPTETVAMRRLFAEVGREDVESLLELMEAWKPQGAALKACREEFAVCIEMGVCLSKKEMQLTGTDLIAMGMRQGKEIGQMVDALFDAVLQHPEYNTKEKLEELAHNWMTPFI